MTTFTATETNEILTRFRRFLETLDQHTTNMGNNNA